MVIRLQATVSLGTIRRWMLDWVWSRQVGQEQSGSMGPKFMVQLLCLRSTFPHGTNAIPQR